MHEYNPEEFPFWKRLSNPDELKEKLSKVVKKLQEKSQDRSKVQTTASKLEDAEIRNHQLKNELQLIQNDNER